MIGRDPQFEPGRKNLPEAGLGLPVRPRSFPWSAESSFAVWKPRHQVYVEFVELLCINIKLHVSQARVGWNVGGGIPEDGLAVTGSVIYVDVHEEPLLTGD